MSFKTKRWAEMRTVHMEDFVPGIYGAADASWAIPWGGKIVVMAYLEELGGMYTFYDPISNTISDMTIVGRNWGSYSSYYGQTVYPRLWGRRYLLLCPVTGFEGVRPDRFCGFTSDLSFLDPPFPVGDRDTVHTGMLGSYGGEPCYVSYQYRRSPRPTSLYALVMHTLHGASVAYEGEVEFAFSQGRPIYNMARSGEYWRWTIDDDGTTGLFSSPPTSTEELASPIVTGNFLTNHTYPSDGAGSSPTPDPSSGQTWQRIQLTGGPEQWVHMEQPLSSGGERPWGGYLWDYRHMRDGGYQIDEHDLDGIEHLEMAIPGPGEGPITRMTNGWYCGLNNTNNPLNFTVYVLDPGQPSRQARTVRKMGVAPACFVGDYAIGDDLKAAHVLPFPDERDPSAASIPPQDRRDGYVIGHKELFKRAGTKFVYKRPMKLAFEAYGSGDWWYPGENPDHTLDTTLDLFAGERTVMGRYPDPSYGRLSPVGQFADRGIGVPTENLRAQEPDPIYVVKNSQVIDETMGWVTPGPMNPVGYSFLRGSLTDARLCYHELYVVGGSPPQWHARGGLVQGDEWHDLLNLDAMDMPELGQDGWTIYGLCPIPACRGLKKGGWLVCAELYFAPWEAWEGAVGPRDLTFRSTGNGWVPAKKGYIGPLEIEDWHPRLLSGYDEWTFNRSDYGPAALLVYDNEGEFVECLNDETMYPPQAGPEVAILPGSVPRLIYRVKGGGTYSDCAEYWDCYQNNSGEADFQAPLFAVYELERSGRIQVGAGAFLGFVDMYELERYETRDAGWRWGALGAALDWQYPKNIWAPYSRVKLREGVGGSGLTLLSPRGMSTRTGVNGITYRS